MSTSISEYSAGLLEVAEELTMKDVKKLLFLFQIPRNDRDNVESATDLFDLLMKKAIISEGNLAELREGLKKIGRVDVIKLLPGSASSRDIEGSNFDQQHLVQPGDVTGARSKSGSRGVIGSEPQPFRRLSEAGALPQGNTAKAEGRKEGGPNGERQKPASTSEHLGSSTFSTTHQWAPVYSPAKPKESSSTDWLPKGLRDLSLRDDHNLQTDSPSLAGQRMGPLVASAQGSGQRGGQAVPSAGQQQVGLPAGPLRLSTGGRDHPRAQRAIEVGSCRPAGRPQEDVRALHSSSSLDGLSVDSPAGPGLGAGGDLRPRDAAVDASVQHLEKMMDQQAAREEARSADRPLPTLRRYQLELACRPLNAFKNYIICAPTGSGKTLTAAYICREYWTSFRHQRHYKALFIVNMRHLTRQQRDAFQKYFPEQGAVQTISDQETFAEALKLDEPLPLVLMVTAQVLVNALNSRSVRLEDFAMFVFDECHHTDLKHPYNEIMKRYLKMKSSLPRSLPVGESGDRLPFVIGLSASLGTGGDPMGHLLKLCANMDAIGVARVLVNVEELERHVNSPVNDVIRSVSRRDEAERQYGILLERLMEQVFNELPDKEGIPPLPEPGTQEYEGESKKRQIQAEEAADRTAFIVYMYLYQYNRALMLYEDLRVSDSLDHLERFHGRRRMANKEQVPVEDFCARLIWRNLPAMQAMKEQEPEHSNQMLAELAFRLQEVFTQKPHSKGIVLARTKMATLALTDFIRSSTVIEALPCTVLPMRFVGQGDVEDGCMTEAEQRSVLESFRKEDGCNVLVATDIAQEGLDMPACNFVIRYNFVSNEIGTVQSKGRARAVGSNCYLIVESDSRNERREMDNHYRVSQMNEAMEKLESMTEFERPQKIKEKQDEVLEKIRREEEEAECRQSQHQLDKITIHCKECSALICRASELRRKGDAGHVTCIRPNFQREIREKWYNRPERYPDSETLGLVYCGTEDCRAQLGTMQNFRLLHPPRGYALKASAFKVQMEDGTGMKPLKQWNKAGFTIPQETNA